MLSPEPEGFGSGVEFYGRGLRQSPIEMMTVRDSIDFSQALWVHLSQTQAIYCCMLPRAIDVERFLRDLRTPGPVSQSVKTPWLSYA